jgi:hypothetical protein
MQFSRAPASYPASIAITTSDKSPARQSLFITANPFWIRRSTALRFQDLPIQTQAAAQSLARKNFLS